MVLISKRDSRKVVFDKSKIVNAILKSFLSVDGEINEYSEQRANNIANYIEEKVNENPDKIFSVEEIQDLVEKGLMSGKRKDVAKAYVLYREKRRINRLKNTSLLKNITEKIECKNVKNQNANVDEKSFGGRMGEANSATMKQYALDYCITETSKQNHLNNRIYIHDLDAWAVGSHNCLTIPFDDLLAKGFNTRQTDVRPARSINTAMQLLAVIFQLESLQQFG